MKSTREFTDASTAVPSDVPSVVASVVSSVVASGIAVAFVAALSSCNGETSEAASLLQGSIAVDGSSTVFPISEAVAEEFGKVHPRVRVDIGVSGTGGGFKKFCSGRTLINDASRPIKAKEIKLAEQGNVQFIELPIAYDGLTVVVNKSNTFVDYLTIAELRTIWAPGSKVSNWNQVRDGFPDLPMKLYGPGVDSGTFDYFTKAINGKEGACRPDFTQSEDDNVLVNGVAGDKGGLGFFGFAYFAENRSKLNAVPIKSDEGAAVGPSLETINNGTYKPLSRPIFIYVAASVADRADVKTFVEFYLENAAVLVEEVGYVKLPDAVYSAAKQRFARKVTGTLYQSGDAKSKSLIDLYN